MLSKYRKISSIQQDQAALKVELALLLYTQYRLSIGKARELANMSLWEFRQLLASRKIPAHYDINDLNDDVSMLKQLGRL